MENAQSYFADGMFYIEPLMPVWSLGNSGDWNSKLLRAADGLVLRDDGTLVYREVGTETEYDSAVGAMVEKTVIDREEPVQAVCLGEEYNGNYRVIYRPGDEIPLYDGPSDAIPFDAIPIYGTTG